MGADLSESISIFAISLMLSSVQIYNIRGNLTRSDLEHLRLFASYGKLLQEQNENTCPFQRLIFTIRDWDLDDELGLEAGSRFLQSVLDEMGDTEEGADLMQSIRTSFTKINCCLMRHPGSALRSDDFKGESDQLDDEFKENLTELIPFIANDDTDASNKCPTLKESLFHITNVIIKKTAPAGNVHTHRKRILTQRTNFMTQTT